MSTPTFVEGPLTDEADLRARHLDTIQAIIGRLSQNSFTVRGWSVTLVSAVFAVLATQAADHRLVLFALLPAWMFWGLDASYVRHERVFRALYAAAARRLVDPTAQPDVPPYSMDAAPFLGAVPSWRRLLVSTSVVVTPAVITLIVVAYAIAR